MALNLTNKMPFRMNQYLTDTEFATDNLFKLATEEGRRLQELLEGLKPVEERLKIQQWDFQSSDLNEDFPDAYVMAAFHRAAKTHQEAQNVRHQIAKVQASVDAHRHAVQSIAGAIFQIAKQGISVVFEKLTLAPPGRMLGSLALRDIIWQARNQSMHYEEGKPGKGVVELFGTLEQEYGMQFSLTAHPESNRAKQVLDLLGWTSYEFYLEDMQTLLS